MRLGTLTLACCAAAAGAFAPAPVAARPTQLRGMFDFITDAFKNEAFDDRRAKASHILVKSEQEASDIAARLASGETTFGDAARAFSTCPSAKSGGSLGSFEPGKMVKEFDAVCFDEAVPVGECVGPIKTQFGWHLVVVQERFTNQERSEGSSVF